MKPSISPPAAYIPLEIFRSPSLGRIALVLAVDAAIFLISARFFHLGLRRYESGNRIGSRIWPGCII